MCLMTACWGGRGPCALGAPRRRRREAARDAAAHLPRGLDEGRARLRRLEVGLEEEVEERRGAFEVDEEERGGKLKVERHPPAYRGQPVERRQDEVEEQVLAGRGRLASACATFFCTKGDDAAATSWMASRGATPC